MTGLYPIQKHYFMYCHNFHLVLSTQTSLLLDHLCHVCGSSLTWWTCVTIWFSFFTGSCFTLLGMCGSIQLSLVGLFLMSSRHLCDMSWLGVLLIILFFQNFWFCLEHALYCLCIIMRLFTLDSCGDYRLVWCVAFFSKTTNLVVSFGLHQWIQLVDVPCPACVLFWLSRSDTATLFVNVFTLFTIVNIAAEEPSVEQAKLVLHTSCTNDWLRAVCACLSHSACWCFNVPLVSNLLRMSCNLCALVMVVFEASYVASTMCCAQVQNQ